METLVCYRELEHMHYFYLVVHRTHLAVRIHVVSLSYIECNIKRTAIIATSRRLHLECVLILIINMLKIVAFSYFSPW